MALGGGTFLTQNKVLPGTYHNFISAARAFVNLSDRGYVGLPIALDWGPDGEVFAVTQEDLQKNSRKIFGYDYTDPKLKGIRDIFKNAITVYFYKLAVNAKAASNTYATAKYKGVRGNDIKIVIQANVDEPAKFDVQTYLNNVLVSEQNAVSNAAELVSNDYVTFKSGATLAVTAGTPLSGGSNGDAVTGGAHQEALDALEAYGFNTIGCLSNEQTVKFLYIEYTKRLRDQVGAKFQLVGHKLGTADHEGIIDVQNDAIGEGEDVFGAVYWSVGAQAGVAVNKSNTNKRYDGEFTIDMAETKTQSQLTALLKAGKYVFHRVGEETRVLEDVNTFTSFTVDKNEDFSMNQVIRVLDQIAIDTANLFNTRYLGKVPNDDSGRVSLWGDIVAHRKELQRIRAIQNFDSEQVKVAQGSSKKSVVVDEVVIPTVAMSQLYITTTVA
ncbi:phage tail sheath subtilisin-like domain-containing protein [Schinkia azotoformans]|uniref:phage tail sheath subtilisin-like domain-containing protein n=1 Tax=Schinkia azotoformans TaxID=1454 RepID=UPI002DB8BFEA|nr:phage tail sheath subtilisin-like domain-containing protein [Schinkia azotoformans]MEC1716605.1 phage tail sheath C-terminal domain-containing protein [Schinkia azotoformans]MEC1739443.1 phage tail sheath C-terminal domain-containing protein [Schinkia azotoformans]MEC1745487.1 phage tail sheath C-terminal domain-containing protein [Schinkia azotoformans]MEC1756550.1 phage tail sheath C-terminal domain-containing protein [Schinkia azotoformans]MEC1765817.1 phage tail sheath C-terminal domain